MEVQKLLKTKKVFLGIFVLSSIPLFAYFTLFDSLKLALPGDDWLLLYTIWQIFDVRQAASFWNPATYLCTYCPHYATLSIVKYFWGFNPYYYYLVSLVTKILGSFAIFLAVKQFTKRGFTAYIAALLYVVSYIGIQTTDWVFNFNHYIGVAGAATFLLFYWKLKSAARLKYIILAGLFFAFSLIISPPRMHGLFPLVLIAELGWYVIEKRKYSFRNLGIRMAMLVIIYLVIISAGGYGTGGYFSTISDNFTAALQNIKSSNTEFLFNPIATAGNYILPDKAYELIPFSSITILNKPAFTFFTHIVPIGAVFLIITLPLIIALNGKKTIFRYLLLTGLSLIVVRYIKFFNLPNISPDKVAYLAIGTPSLILTVFLFIKVKTRQPLLAHTLYLSYFWMFSFTIFPWLLAPNSMLVSWSRYSLHQSAGLAIWIATLSSLYITNITNSKFHIKKVLVFIALIFIVGGHIFLTKNYLSVKLQQRSQTVTENLWRQLKSEVPKIDKDESSVFYLKHDDYQKAEEALRFGFSARAAMEYNITKQENNPFMIYEYNDVLSIVKDGQAFEKQIGKSKQIPLDNVYALQLKDDKLINITEETREKIKNDLNEAH